MHFQTVFLPVLAVLTLGADAASYRRCKCHDSGTKLQNDYVTEQACKKYSDEVSGGVSYDPNANHSCRKNNDIGGDLIDNKEWDKKCKSFGQQYYQWCWDKAGWLTKKDGMEATEWEA